MSKWQIANWSRILKNSSKFSFPMHSRIPCSFFAVDTFLENLNHYVLWTRKYDFFRCKCHFSTNPIFCRKNGEKIARLQVWSFRSLFMPWVHWVQTPKYLRTLYFTPDTLLIGHVVRTTYLSQSSFVSQMQQFTRLLINYFWSYFF